jgi:hypothetical protein
MCFGPSLNAEQRDATLVRLTQQWEGEARRDLAKWYAVKHENGKEYFCHRDTGESMWTHPAEVVMPQHYIKIQAVQQLRDSKYFQELERTTDEKYRISPGGTTKKPKRTSSAGSQSSTTQRPAEEDQKEEHSLTNSSLQFELQMVQKDLRKLKEESLGSEERHTILRADLIREKQRAKECQKELAEISAAFTKASENLIEVERTKSVLEMKLAALEGDTRRKAAILGVQEREDVPTLEKTFSEESMQREVLLANDAALAELAEQLRRAEAAKEDLQRQLADAERERQAAQAAQAVQPESSDLRSKLREAYAQQSALRERLQQAEEELRAAKDKGAQEEEVHAQAAETKRKLDHLMQNAQESERDKGIAESKLAQVRKEIQDVENKLVLFAPLEAALKASSLGDRSAVKVLERELRITKGLQKGLQDELKTVYQEAKFTPSVGVDPLAEQRMVDLKVDLANERLNRMQLEQRKANNTAGPPQADLALHVDAANAEALKAEERANAAEAQLAKERDAFTRVWECVSDAEKAKDVLEVRLVAMERHFKDGVGKDPQNRIDRLQVELGEEKRRGADLQLRAKELEAGRTTLEQQLHALKAS